ncbi:MAG: porin family protein [Alphaproteobacteria bacterium]|nr:porin family protein [Alphaproteobacteria bacterium]
MKKLLVSLFCLMPVMANATMIYRVQKTWGENGENGSHEAFASKHRFYAGGMYDFSMWRDYTADDMVADGKDTSGFDLLLGFRLFDTFRIEADYLNTRAKWNDVSVKTNTVFLNMIVDARIDGLYRMLYNQKIVPYVGAGFGATWFNSDDIEMENDTVPSFAALAGIGLELSEHFALDFGYRYVYMLKPKVEGAHDLIPHAHQLRVGAHINF